MRVAGRCAASGASDNAEHGRLARTTNAALKVNQPSLESITFIAPPLDSKDVPTTRDRVDKLKAAQRASLGEMDALFASLQHRAFRGEL
jgi:type I restriction enzyme S subunit